MAPKIDPASDAMLVARYDELYNNSPAFQSRLHNVVTAARALRLDLNAGLGDAHYVPETHTITVFQHDTAGVARTPLELRDQLFFEMHNAKLTMAISDVAGLKGYNKATLANDIKKEAGYALAIEWLEWNNVAESVLLTTVVNSQSAMGPLVPGPSPFRASFNPGAGSWLKFSNYLDVQIATGHTGSYDAKATPGAKWAGKDILRVVGPKVSVDLEITANEFMPAAQSPKLNSRANPFVWSLVKPLQLS